MPDDTESTRAGRKRGRKGGTKRPKAKSGRKKADARPLGAREPRQLSPEELEALRHRLQRKFR
jgi:hypothetical protein